ncbi:hypothetical protein [Nonomuraea longicatena]|uniref:Uncharacterized protein n=1 Tax=Nonomuraea longicatena TaxID=83682 RepID=A0ABN1QU50_9ACTN
MKHAVHVNVLAEVAVRPLDELRCHGAEALFSDALGGADVIDFRAAAHPDGLLLVVFVDTGTEEQAVTYVRDLVEDVLTHTSALAGWQVVHCRLASDAPDLSVALDAADLDLAVDPAALNLASDAPGLASGAADLGLASGAAGRRSRRVSGRAPDLPEPRARHLAARRAALVADAAQVRAFGLDSFAYRPHDPARSVPREDAAVAAGALVRATVRLLDQLFADVRLLADAEPTSTQDAEPPSTQDAGPPSTQDAGPPSTQDAGPSPAEDAGLSPAYAARYTAAYARRFLVAAACVTGRLADRVWRPPAGIAEAIALDLLVDHAKALVIAERLMDVDRAETVYAAFSQRAYDHREPYRSELDGIHHDTGPVGFGSWFVPFDPERRTHPYGQDAACGEPDA